MKKWILTVFGVQPILGKRVAAIDEKIERIAIIYLNGYKARLVNLKIMADVISKRIGQDRAKDLAAYAAGKSAREIASTNGNNQFTVYRRIMKSVAEATEELEDCGYDERKMDRDYGGMKFIRAVMAGLEGKLRGK